MSVYSLHHSGFYLLNKEIFYGLCARACFLLIVVLLDVCCGCECDFCKHVSHVTCLSLKCEVNVVSTVTCDCDLLVLLTSLTFLFCRFSAVSAVSDVCRRLLTDCSKCSHWSLTYTIGSVL